MSDFRAISGVSSSLRTLLRDRMDLPGGVSLTSLAITISTPHAEGAQPGQPSPEAPRVNLFLYQVTESPFLKNQDLPARGHPAAYGIPPLSLNLHYLVTAYGANLESNNAFANESQAQLLLGSAMRVLHDYPVIADGLQTVRDPVGQTILHPSLQRQYERIKICLDPLSLEDLTKIWTALTIPYRLSAAYSVSLVQIESRRARRFPRLVGEPSAAGPMITVIPLQTPVIQSLAVRRPGDPPDAVRAAPYARIGDTLIVQGQNFAGGTATVAISGTEIPAVPVSAGRIELVVPDDQFTYHGVASNIPPDRRLQPGVHDVEVKSAPARLPQAAARSNRAAMMIVPHLQNIATAAPRRLTLTGTRLFADDLEGETLVGRVLYSADAYDVASPTSIQLTLPDTFPYRSASALVGDVLGAPPSFPGAVDLEITIGGDGPHPLQLPPLTGSLETTARELELAIRALPDLGPAFREARVGVVDNRIVVVPGGLEAAVTAGGADAGAFGLGTAAMRRGYLSGALDPFTPLSAPPGAVSVTIGGATRTLSFGAAPASAADAAAQLRSTITAEAAPAFADALVLLLGSQVLIIPGVDAGVDFGPVPGGDATTAGELQLRARYPVRVRVNGAEGIGGASDVELPL